MLRDIDYAAAAVKTAIVEKFGRLNPIDNLRVTANEKTITLQDSQQVAEGTRDELLAAVRAAGSYDQFWNSFSDAPVPGANRIIKKNVKGGV
jgi:hypothetical protein